MSCFIVEPQHIAELVKQYETGLGEYKPSYFRNLYTGEEIKFDKLDFPKPVMIAFILASANIKSYNARYPKYKASEEDIHFLSMIENEMQTPRNHKLKWNEIINMCRCLDYQSCDFNGWTKSDAFFILETLKDCFVNAWSREVTDEDKQVTWSYPK